MSRYQCTEEGCERGPETGDALHRTSPKGELFEGKCTEHAPDPEPLAVLIERAGRDDLP
jgi:hypothetical protein